MSEPKLISLDLETLSTRNDAAIIAIGVAMWVPGLVHAHNWEIVTHRWLIHPDQAIGHRDPATIDWWRQQDESIRDEVWGGKQGPLLVIGDFLSFIRQHASEPETEFWAGPAHFDFPVIETLIHVAGLERPWNYRQKKCLSTLSREMIRVGFPDQKVPSERLHEPVADATAQLVTLMTYKRVLRTACDLSRI